MAVRGICLVGEFISYASIGIQPESGPVFRVEV